MSVGFDITANTQSAKTALKQLQDAFRQLQQEGKKFTEIDLNDIGAGALNDDLKKILENWRRMTDPRLGGKLAERLQRSGQQDKAPGTSIYGKPTPTRMTLRSNAWNGN